MCSKDWTQGTPTEKGWYWLVVKYEKGAKYSRYSYEGIMDKIFAWVGYPEYDDELQYNYHMPSVFNISGDWHPLSRVIQYIKADEPEWKR